MASCVACHRLNGVGSEIGPDLTKLDPKLKPTDILKDILEPSSQINEKYQTYIFETDAGKTVTGLILEETADTVKVIENPLAKAEPVVLKKSSIESAHEVDDLDHAQGPARQADREEILDLVAYVDARGNPKHKVFQGEHHH